MHLPAPRGRDDGAADTFRLLLRDHGLSKRAERMSGVSWAMIGIFVGILGLFILTGAIFLLRRRRKTPRQKAEGSRKSGFWAKIFGRKRGEYEQTSGGRNGNRRGNASHSANNARNNGTIDRNTSIRSVITLPAYRQAASHEERVLGREGERDGVDVIIDMPTQEDEEAMREQEMDTLYQIRLARRQQLAEREERRLARERGIQPARTRDENREAIRDLRVEVDRIKENRNRSVSSVSYGDLGVARHDGSRVRAGSNDSERMGLLNDAASISRAGAASPRPAHLRGRSTSSISALSMDNDGQSLHIQPTRSGETTPRMSVSGMSQLRVGSTPELVSHEDVQGNDGASPPEYEDVSLDADDASRRAPSPYERAETPMNEPPPDYPGAHRSESQRTSISQVNPAQSTESFGTSGSGSGSENGNSSRGVGNKPQLPSLRLGRLPSIVIEPSSAVPRRDDAA